jgi:hypothetical protein
MTPQHGHEYIVTTAADSATVTSNAQEYLQPNTTITLIQPYSPEETPRRLRLNPRMPEIENDYLTLNASNSGVILDGSHLSEGNWLTVAHRLYGDGLAM